MLAAQPTITHFVPRFPTNGRRILQSIAIRQTENRRFSCRDKDLRAVAHLCSSARRDSNGLGCHVNVIPEVCDSTSLEIGCPGRLAPRSSGGGTDPARRMSRRLPGTRPANPEGAASEKARGPRMRAVDRMKWSGPVGRILSAVAGGTVIPLGRRLPDGSSHLPARSGGRPAPAANDWQRVPIRCCSGWGLACRCRHRQRGELLPRHFTLAAKACAEEAVCFLCHFPSPWAGSRRLAAPGR